MERVWLKIRSVSLKKTFFLIVLFSISLLHATQIKVHENLPLPKAIEILKKQNIEIDITAFDQRVSALGVKIANGYNFGKLDATLMGMRSNDAGNVFGFKLQSREADFGDFGFDQFLDAFGGAMMTPEGTLGDFTNFAQNLGNPLAQEGLLAIQPKELNFPKARDHFDTKLTYVIPLFTGFKLKNYKDIAKNMLKMSKLDQNQVISQKFYEVKKVYYDISLLDDFLRNLTTIESNIQKLELTTREMRKEGYAKKTDLLEVQSKLANIERMLSQTRTNKELSYQFLSFLLNEEVKSIKRVSLGAPEIFCTIDELIKKNLDISKAETGLDIQSKMVSVASSTYYPEVGAFAEYGSSDDTLFNDFKDHDRYTVGVQLKWNLFNGGVDRAKIESERLKALKVARQVELAKKGIKLKFRKIKSEIKNYNAQIESLQKEIDLTSEIFLGYQERYKEGLASINDVIIKQSLQIEKLLKLQEVHNKRNERVLSLSRLFYRGEK